MIIRIKLLFKESTVFGVVVAVGKKGKKVGNMYKVETRRKKISFKEGVSLHSQPKVRFREYFEYFLMRQKSLKNQPFGSC